MNQFSEKIKLFDDFYAFQQFGNKISFYIKKSMIIHPTISTWKVLFDYWENKEKGEINHSFLQKHSISQIELAIEELKQMVKEYSHDNFSEAYDFNKLPSLKAISFNITHKCNLKCSYCFRSSNDLKFNYGACNDSMTEEVAMAGVDLLLQESRKAKDLRIGFFGGEPLLEMNLIRKTIDYAKMKGRKYEKEFSFHVTTNGTLLNESLQSYFIDNGVHFIISLDGSEKEHNLFRRYRNGKGSYHKTLKNTLSFMNKVGGNGFIARGTFFKPTLNFSDIVLHLVQKGFKIISVENGVLGESSPWAITMADIPGVVEEYDKLAKIYLNHLLNGHVYDFYHFTIVMDHFFSHQTEIRSCMAGVRYLNISPDGNIWACHKFVNCDKYYMGNVLKGIENRNPGISLLKFHVDAKDICKDCWARYICAGSCHADNEQLNGDARVPVRSICEIRKHRIKLGAWLYLELQEKHPDLLRKFCEKTYVYDDYRPKQREGIKSKDGYLINMETGGEYILNKTAKIIWELCTGQNNVLDIARYISKDYCKPEIKNKVLEDVKRTIKKFKKAKLLK